MNLISGPNDFPGPTRPVDFIRHGHTALNGSPDGGDRIRGWVDIPLDDRGIQDAEKIGKTLTSLKTRPQILFSSDLQRALKTAHIISQASGIPLAPPTHGLRPWNLGHFQGMESSQIAPQMKMFINNPGQRVPGGESFNEFSNRFLFTMRQILASTRARPGIISHHRNERLLAAREKTGWTSVDKTEFTKHGSPPGVLITFEMPFYAQQNVQRGGQLPPGQR